MASVPGSTFGTWRYADSIRLGGASLDFQSWETLKAGVGESEKRRAGVHRLPHLKIEMWATHRYWPDMGHPPNLVRRNRIERGFKCVLPCATQE